MRNKQEGSNGLEKIKILAMSAAVLSASTMTMASGEDAYNNFGCAGCHGANGISNSEAYPNLAGQKVAYTVKQIKDFQTGDRNDPTMNAMAAMLVGQEQAVAEYIADLK